MALVLLSVFFGVVIVAGTIAGLRMKSTPDGPRRRGGWMRPILSVYWALGGILGGFYLMTPVWVLHSLVTTGDAWPDEVRTSFLTYVAGALAAVIVVALFAVFFAQWWQPLYVFGFGSAGIWVASDPSDDDPSGLRALLDHVPWSAGAAALAATGILLRLLANHLRRREGAASVGTLIRLYGEEVRTRPHRRRVQPPTR